jgi:peptidoglycan lytic transglycosylase
MLGRYRDSVRAWSDPFGALLFRLHLRPNHLTVMGLGVSLLAAAAFIDGRTRWAGVLLILAGLFDLFDGSLARASGQVTPFGAFLDSVIDRYSDLVVLLGIVVLFARTPHARGALVAMAGLVGSVMVSYTKARAESIGIECRVGFMERPERMICLIAGALFDLLEPALWVLAILSNLTALHRIAFTRRMTRDLAVLPAVLGAVLLAAGPASGTRMAMAGSEPSPHTTGAAPPAAPGTGSSLAPAAPAAVSPAAPAAVADLVSPETERAWAAAVAEFQLGSGEAVRREFSTDAAQASAIAEYLRLVLADALTRDGELASARATLLAVADRHLAGRLASRALRDAAVLASRAGDEAEADALLARLLDTHPGASEIPEALYLSGQTAEARGLPETAVQAYRKLLVLAPATAYADGAADRLAALAARGTPAAPLTLEQRLDRVERLLRAGVAAQAVEEAEGITRETREPAALVRAFRVAGTGAQRLRRFDAAARGFELAAQQASGVEKVRLQLDHARMVARAGQPVRALALYATLAAAAPEAEAAEALLQRARLLDEQERPTDAAKAYQAVVSRYPGREAAAFALWRLGWLAYLRGDHPVAEKRWSRLSEMPAGRTHRVAALYWKARALEAERGAGAAEKTYRQLLAEAPCSYHGLLAAARTGAPATVTAAATSPRWPDNPVEALAGDAGFARVELLRRIGLPELALEELDDIVQRSVGDPLRLYRAAGTYVRDERYHLALRIVRRHYTALLDSGDPSLPRAFWELVYPLGWRTDLVDTAATAGVDPYLVAAVVREESSYYPRALSRAGARGLMQVMPATAQLLTDGRSGAGDVLDDPRLNLQLGTSYLAGLLRDFGDPRLAVAAYNAGPNRLRQWWQARRTSDIEAFVEQIPFDETRRYVQNVMRAWAEYRRIYDGAR